MPRLESDDDFSKLHIDEGKLSVAVRGQSCFVVPAFVVDDVDVDFFGWFPAGAAEPDDFARVVIVFVGGQTRRVKDGGVLGLVVDIVPADNEEAVVAGGIGVAGVVN